jgi:hypothetical protein
MAGLYINLLSFRSKEYITQSNLGYPKLLVKYLLLNKYFIVFLKEIFLLKTTDMMMNLFKIYTTKCSYECTYELNGHHRNFDLRNMV